MARLLAAGLALSAGVHCARKPSPAELAGKALFSGSVPLKARMVGHDTDLPAAAVRCVNCHSRTTPPPAASAPGAPSTTPTDIYGALLTRQALVERVPRRGGPPSSYDVSNFCRVLREGIDPAHVMIVQTMPRYRLTDQECHDLWSYVTAR